VVAFEPGQGGEDVEHELARRGWWCRSPPAGSGTRCRGRRGW
jgi:hypothetical protein